MLLRREVLQLPTFKDVLAKVVEAEGTLLVSVNQNMSEISKSTKRRDGFVKIRIDDKTADGLMTRRLVGFILFIDAAAVNDIADQLGESENE